MNIEELKQALEVVFKRHAKAVDTRGIRNAPTDWHVGQALDAVIPVLAENAKLLKVAEAVDIDCLERAGWWMSAALEDPIACAECKQDFGAALDQIEALRKALEELNNE